MDAIDDTESVLRPASMDPSTPAQPGMGDPVCGPLLPQQAIEPCPTCAIPGTEAAAPPSFVYAIGEIDFLASSELLEQEMAQVMEIRKGDLLKDVTSAFEQQKKILMAPEYRYIVRQLCWVLRIETLQTYLLQPRDPADFALLVEAFSPHSRDNVDVVIGVRGPMAPPGMCGGLGLPILLFDQLYYFDKPALIGSIVKSLKAKTKGADESARQLFDRIQQMTDNHGATDEHRALNYLAVRAPRIYDCANEMSTDGFWLTAIDVVPSRLSGSRGRKLLDAIFTYSNPTNRVARKWFWRVDVTGEFPFIVTGQQEYFDR